MRNLPRVTVALAGLIPACELHGFEELVPPTVDEDPDLPAIEVNGTRLHLETFGDPDDPPIVLLHGGPCDDYRYLLRLRERVDGYALEDDHRLVLFDQRGGGLSRRHDVPEELTLDLWVEDLVAVIDEVAGDEPVVLVGHSGGGLLAVGYTDRHPERVRGLVLLEPSPFTGPLAEEVATTTSLPTPLTEEWVNDWAWGRGVLGPADHARADYTLTQGVPVTLDQRHSEGPVPAWRHGMACKLAMTLGEMAEYRYDFTARRLDEYDGEALFVVGGETEDLGRSFQEEQLGFFRHARLEEIEGAGHNDVVYWRAEDTLPVLHDFVRSLP